MNNPITKEYDIVRNVLQDPYRVGKSRIIGQVGKHPHWKGASVYMFQTVVEMRIERSPMSSVRSLFWPEMK